MSIYKFYKTLFNEGEGACASLDIYGTSVIDYDFIAGSFKPFFCINPLLKNKDLAPSKAWHKDTAGRRADCNVTAYRNILCEFDKIDLVDQEALIRNSGIPYSTIVYSGGKSLHCIISLKTPANTLQEYKELTRAIYKKLGGAKVVDTSNCNPSRFSRCPGAIRDNGVQQKLIEVRGRVSKTDLDAWLGPRALETPLAQGNTLKRILNKNTNYFLVFGAPEGEWNSTLFKSACDMKRAGYTEEEIYLQVQSINGTLDSNDKKTIKSAINTARNND